MTNHQKLLLTRYTNMVIRQYEEELAKENKTPAIRHVLDAALEEAKEIRQHLHNMLTSD